MPPETSSTAGLLPPLPSVEEIRRRLALIFPEVFPDRRILVGEMAARVIFVFIYGGSVEGFGRYLRPAHVYLFTAEQSQLTSETDRLEWVIRTRRQGYRPAGTSWYADTSKETIRDDLMRNQLLRLGIMQKLPGIQSVSPKPTSYLRADFVALFDPSLAGEDLAAAISAWAERRLSPSTLQRMALRAQGIQAKDGDVFINLPDGSTLRISGGASALITKDVVEQFARRHLKHAAVLWVSASDKKAYPQFVELCSAVGLEFDLGAELPDLILADMTDPIRILFCEIVASDGPVTEARQNALFEIVDRSQIPRESVEFLTAFEDREATPFRKTFSQLAGNSMVWFRTEPGLLVTLRTA